MIRAACHLHSTWSYDGKWTLERLAGFFSRRGYSLLMVTEHDQGFSDRRHRDYLEACARASKPGILVLPGMEYSDASNTVHVLVWGPVPFLGQGLPTHRLLSEVRAAGGVAVLAHPSRRAAWRLFDPAWSPYLLGIELWNRKTDGWAASTDARKLLASTTCQPFVGMDFHEIRQLFPLQMRASIPPPSSPTEAYAALAARRFRAYAFHLPIDHFLLHRARPALGAVESLRRGIASLVRRRRRPPLVPRHTPKP